MNEMDDLSLHLLDLSEKGYYCSQILLILALEAQGREDADLIRAMRGVALGGGAGTGTCGALEGGASLIALHAGKGRDEEEEHESLPSMLAEFWEWFETEVGAKYGGVKCDDILADGTPRRQRCGPIVAAVYGKAMDILVSQGFDPTESRDS